MHRKTALFLCVMLLTGLALIGPTNRVSAHEIPKNVQFKIGCSGFSASADAQDGFGFYVYRNDPPSFNVGQVKEGSGKFTISASYGVTLPEGTLVNYVWGNSEEANDSGTAACTGNTDAPPLPTDFVLRTLSCTTPIYDSVGGRPVGSGEVVTVGQTWFVNPVSKTDANGRSWTEIFVGGSSNGFIPSSCVGVKPPDYGGK